VQHLSTGGTCSCAAQVSIQLGRLTGCLPNFEQLALHLGDDQASVPVDVILEFCLALDGHIVDGPIYSPFCPAGPHGGAWSSPEDSDIIAFSVKVR
jgi:hypothetical protein